MTKAQFRSDVTVTLMDSMGTEESIVRAARVSTEGSDSRGAQASTGLVRFLYREGHGTPFESIQLQFYFEVPIFVSRQIVKHRLCLSGKTRVQRVDRKGGSVGSTNNEIAKMWELWNVGAKRRHRSGKEFRALLPNRKDMWVRSYNENTLEPVTSRVIDIVKNGVKTTVLVTTESGKTIRSTRDHKFFTPNGWKHLYELSEGEYIYRQGKVAVATERQVPPRLRQGIGLWTTSKRPEIIPFDGGECKKCGEHFEFDELELDHIVPVVADIKLALDVQNLQPVCNRCHLSKTSTEQNVAQRLGSRQSLVPDRIVSISDPVNEETYDLVLEGPWHNFIAEGLAVHNSSINEESGRYKELEGVFYLPHNKRKVVQTGKTGAYNFVADEKKLAQTRRWIKRVSRFSWFAYESMLKLGVSKEVSRMVLPVNLYSSMYFTANLRSVLNFLSLRKDWGPDAVHQSKAQDEISQVADEIARYVAKMFPTVWEMFVASGYQAV